MTTNLNQPGYGKQRRGTGRRSKRESLPKDKKVRPAFVDNYNFESHKMWGPTLNRHTSPPVIPPPPRTRSAGPRRGH